MYGRVLVPAVVEFEYDDSCEKAKLNICEFKEENLEWLQFIVNNRNGVAYVESIHSQLHNLGLIYDICKGRIADGKISQLADSLLIHKHPARITDLADVVYKENPYATQISFHTPKALKYLEFKRIIEEVK